MLLLSSLGSLTLREHLHALKPYHNPLIMKRFLSILFLMACFPGIAFLQKTYPMGLIMDDEAYLELPYTSENIEVEDGRRFNPHQVDLSAYCPEIKHQGEIASCVGWATGYGAMTIERAIKNNWTDKKTITANANSALFIYNQVRQDDCMRGLNIHQTLKSVQDNGNCLARDFDYRVDINDCSIPISTELKDKARNYRIADFIRLFDVQATSADKIRRVKSMLIQNKPVVVGMKVLQNFYNIQEGDANWWPKVGDTGYAGGHAMVVVGFDDNKFPNENLPPERRGSFKLMNSWGKDWGQDGFIWIKYEDFAEHCRYACAMMLEIGGELELDVDFNALAQTEPEPEIRVDPPAATNMQAISGAFGFRHYIGWDNARGPMFREAPVKLVDNYIYKLEGDWKIGDQFQLYTTSGFANGYVYVFSIDDTGKAELHFPRSAAYDPRFGEANETALVMESGSVLTIPEKNSVLKLAQPGTDQLVVLFSTTKIVPRYMESLRNELADHQSSLTERLHKILRRHMIGPDNISYQSTEMGFQGRTDKQNFIVPIVLKVDVSG